MQRRMSAGLKREMPDVTPINFASYRVRMAAEDGKLTYDHEPLGMWDPRRYLSLLMGEIPRLTDDEGGYGPKGAGFRRMGEALQVTPTAGARGRPEVRPAVMPPALG